jgi:hypothetical protein
LILSTRITVNECPRTGYDEDVDDVCMGCKYYYGITTDAEVQCLYREKDEEDEGKDD